MAQNENTNVALQLTEAGRDLLMRAISGEQITFTRVAIGSGAAVRNPRPGSYWYDTLNEKLYVCETKWVRDGRWFTASPFDDSRNPATGLGSLWYDTDTGTLYLCVLGWTESSKTCTIGDSEPQSPEEGDLWYDTDDEQLKVYDGSDWQDSTATWSADDSESFPTEASEGDLYVDLESEKLYCFSLKWTVASDLTLYTSIPDSQQVGDLLYDLDDPSAVLMIYAYGWRAADVTFTRGDEPEPEMPSDNDLWYRPSLKRLYQYFAKRRPGTGEWVYLQDAVYTESANAPNDISELTGLIREEMSVDIRSYVRHGTSITFNAVFDNSQVLIGFPWIETGVFAKGDGEEEEEALYGYYNAGDSHDWIPPNSIGITEYVDLSVIVAVDNAETIRVLIGDASYWVPMELFQEHINNFNNPHRVTKEQLGLGNVVNLAPPDMDISFDIAEQLSEPNTGETISTVFGKLKRLARSFIAHLRANNPHNLDYNNVNAPPANHASDSATYGKGTDKLYGHVKLMDEPNSSYGVTGGTAATPKALSAVKKTADDAATNANSRGFPSEVITYHGNSNKYGASNKCSITCAKLTPNIVFIIPTDYPGLDPVYAILFVQAGIGFSVSVNVRGDDEIFITESIGYSPLYVSTSGKTVYWYSKQSAHHQLNVFNKTYQCVCI